MGLWLGSGYRLWGGFDSGCSFLAARLNRLVFPKLVEPTRERKRVGRVETVVRVVGVLGRVCRSGAGGFDSAVRFAHALAEPAWEMGPSSVGDGRMST